MTFTSPSFSSYWNQRLMSRDRNSERTYKLSQEECTVLLATERHVVFGFSVVFSVAVRFSDGDAVSPPFHSENADNSVWCFLLEASFTEIAVTGSLEVASEVLHVTLRPTKLLCSV